MNINPLDDIRERYKYGVEVYVDTESQVISTRPRQKLFELTSVSIVELLHGVLLNEGTALIRKTFLYLYPLRRLNAS